MLGFFLVLGACALWAVDTLIRYPLIYGGMSSYSIVFYEHLILSTIFLVVFFKSLKKLKKMKRNHFFYFLVVGGFGSALATLAFTQAFSYLNPSLVILLQKFQPVVAILLARVVLKEKIEGKFILWAGVCLIGALVISYQDMQKVYIEFVTEGKSLMAPGYFVGYLLVGFAVIGWGASTVFGKKLGQVGYLSEQIMAGRFFVGFLVLLCFVPFQDDLFTHNIESYGKISLMVLLSGLLAMYIYYHGLRRLTARSCSLTEMFFPFMAVVVNWIFLDATLTMTQIAGGLILLTGSLVIQLRQY